MAVGGLIDARRRIAEAASRAGRDPDEVSLVVVTKGQSDDDVRRISDTGPRLFAENRADALVARRAVLPDDVRWHFVGSVQRRKAKVISSGIELLHSMDRERLEVAWASLPEPPPVLLELNLGEEPQKHGYTREEFLDAAKRLSAAGIEIRGLMVLPPAPAEPEDSRPWFTELATLGAALRAEYPEAVELSMGMSDDFEVAVECGATMVRLGRTIFVAPKD